MSEGDTTKDDAIKAAYQELDEFAYIVSHDLKEPLRGIHNYAEFLLEDYGDKFDEEGHRMLGTLVKLSHRMGDLIDALLDFSRIGRTELQIAPRSVQTSVDDVLESLSAQLRERQVEVRVTSALPQIECDCIRLGEVFIHLITNAMKFNDSAERWIEIGHEPSRDGQVVIYVRDNGIGIREKHLSSVFSMFRRLHTRDKYGGGVGAGLAFAKKIVEHHGGRIWLESTPGEGTTAYFTLGVASADAAKPDPSGA